MRKKKIIQVFSVIILFIGTISYSVYSAEIGEKKSKDIIKSINELSDKKINSNLKKTKQYKDEILDIDIKKFESSDVSVECDKNGEPIIIENKIKKNEILNNTKETSSLYMTKETLISEETSINENIDNMKYKAEEIVKSLNKNRSIEEDFRYLGNDKIMDGTVAFKWARTMNGYEYDRDFYMVVIDPYDEELVVASKICLSEKPTNKINIEEQQAVKLAKEFINESKVSKCKLKIVNPNYYWTNLNMEWNKESRLAYEVIFDKGNNTELSGEILAVWIDAETGNQLGGYESK